MKTKEIITEQQLVELIMSNQADIFDEVKVMLDAGVNPKKNAGCSRTPLFYAYLTGRFDIIKAF